MSASTENDHDTNAPAADAGGANPNAAPAASGKVWTDEYVAALREEAKTNRLARKAADARLRDVIGLKPDDEINDEKVNGYKSQRDKALTDAMATANTRLIAAAIRALDGYNTKLVEKLVDRSKITVADDGSIKGLKEAVDALLVDFPEIKKAAAAAQATPGANPPGAGVAPSIEQEYKDAMAEAAKNPRNDALKRKAFLLGEKLRKG